VLDGSRLYHIEPMYVRRTFDSTRLDERKGPLPGSVPGTALPSMTISSSVARRARDAKVARDVRQQMQHIRHLPMQACRYGSSHAPRRWPRSAQPVRDGDGGGARGRILASCTPRLPAPDSRPARCRRVPTLARTGSPAGRRTPRVRFKAQAVSAALGCTDKASGTGRRATDRRAQLRWVDTQEG
jgi:hypothetical protein